MAQNTRRSTRFIPIEIVDALAFRDGMYYYSGS
jgi:hypothetical protein